MAKFWHLNQRFILQVSFALLLVYVELFVTHCSPRTEVTHIQRTLCTEPRCHSKDTMDKHLKRFNDTLCMKGKQLIGKQATYSICVTDGATRAQRDLNSLHKSTLKGKNMRSDSIPLFWRSLPSWNWPMIHHGQQLTPNWHLFAACENFSVYCKKLKS